MPSQGHIQRMIDRGRGMAAKVLGGPCTAYRLRDTAAVNFVDPANEVASAFAVYYTQKSSSAFRGSFEGTNLKVPLFDIVADMTNFRVGDVFLFTDAAYPSGYGQGATRVNYPTLEVDGFCLAYHGPVKKSIGARIDRLGSIYSQASGPDPNGYLSADTLASRPLVLSGGTFSLGALGAAPALVPIGLASMPRWRGDLFRGVPTSTSEVVYFMYVPPLPGFTFREGDRVVLQDGSRYVVQNPYEQFVGFSGSQLAVSREGVQS